MTKVFIDGSTGTTGLRLRERLEKREDITLLEIPYESRHDETCKKEIMNASDIVFFCLPDDVAVSDALLVENEHVKIIDTATVHRCDEAWTYGFPELKGQREKIMYSHRVANPGCHASGFIALVAPLVEEGILKKDAFLACTSITGYSGGGKKMIAQYESDADPLLKAPRYYGLTQNHKHLKEMVKYTGLETVPAFMPVVSDYYAGMETIIPLNKKDLLGNAEDIREVYRHYYADKMIRYKENMDESGFISAGAFALRDDMEVCVTGNDERVVLIARFDNLGKGASGSAVQNMNLLIGCAEDKGLVIEGDE